MKEETVQLGFGVSSKYFSVYKAFKEEAEKLGIVWVEKFNPFNEEMFKTRSCIWIQDNWNHAGGEDGMSFSNSNETISLDINFQGAIDAVKHLKANKVKNMTQEQIEKELGYKINLIK